MAWYTFGLGETSWVTDKRVVGGKGTGLMEMTALGMPVPPGVVYTVGSTLGDVRASLGHHLDRLRQRGHTRVSVRSGAPVSMPGMMDTKLGLPIDSPGVILAAAEGVLLSAQSERALAYKQAHGLPADMGTAVIVQAMVHGDKDQNSGTGVVFTRDPSTGKRGLFGEWLRQATGEDLVSGLKSPRKLSSVPKHWYVQLDILARKLEQHFKDMQDVEWTVESDKLWLLQTRTGKRTAKAAVRIALDMVREGLVAADVALSRITPEQVRQLDVCRLPEQLSSSPIAHGMAIVPGVVTGPLRDRNELLKNPEPLFISSAILFTDLTEPKDYPLMQRVAGFVTRTGGATSHAAVVARELGKPCIVGIGDAPVGSGAVVTMCGTTGQIVVGEHETVPAPERKKYEWLVRLAARRS